MFTTYTHTLHGFVMSLLYFMYGSTFLCWGCACFHSSSPYPPEVVAFYTITAGVFPYAGHCLGWCGVISPFSCNLSC